MDLLLTLSRSFQDNKLLTVTPLSTDVVVANLPRKSQASISDPICVGICDSEDPYVYDRPPLLSILPVGL